MSRVFVARDRALDRVVVIKVFPPETSTGLSAERFEREIRLSARLQHPHIVPLLSAGEAEGLPYYTMPLVEGESLRARLEREGPFPIPAVVRILRDVADALAAAHRDGIVHRDIKPANVLMSGEHALVADFGVARALTEAADEGGGLTTAGMAIGTPTYMAPEQAGGEPGVDHRADIYALGVLGYELLTGRPPFHGLTPRAPGRSLHPRRSSGPGVASSVCRRRAGGRPTTQVSWPGAERIPWERARWNAQLGDLDATFQDLDRALEERSVWIPFVSVFPDLEPIRGDARYGALLERMGLR